MRGRFELIIASDVLAGFIALHATPRCEVWIVDPDRGNRPAFNRFMAAAGFALRELRLDRAGTRDAPAYKGRLLTYTRSALPQATGSP